MTITLRKMRLSDADFMLELKNLPETRQYAIASNKEIKKSAHLEWLPKNIQYFKVIEGIDENGRHRLGAVRVQDNEVSIWVSRDHRGKQIAQRVLHQMAEIGMVAKIVSGNIPSMRTFIGAGFKPVEFVDNKYYIFKR
jgi:RimJ/RimL family protein N-acetyltransferase